MMFSKEEKGKKLGHSTEVVLVEYAFDKNLNCSELDKIFPVIAALPIDSKRKFIITLHQIQNPNAGQSDEIIFLKKGVYVLFDKLDTDKITYYRI